MVRWRWKLCLIISLSTFFGFDAAVYIITPYERIGVDLKQPKSVFSFDKKKLLPVVVTCQMDQAALLVIVIHPSLYPESRRLHILENSIDCNCQKHDEREQIDNRAVYTMLLPLFMT